MPSTLAEVLGVDPAAFRERLSRTNHTLKRALTDPTILSGVARSHARIACDFDKFGDAVVQAVQQHDTTDAAVIEALRDAMAPGLEYLKSKTGRSALAGV